MNWYLEVMKKYTVFDGRARRTEYWMFALFYFIFAIVLQVISYLIHTQLLYYVFVLAHLLPAIGVGIRRLHDTGRSGWWMLIAFLPLIGGLILLYFLILDSQPGSNEYGPCPK